MNGSGCNTCTVKNCDTAIYRGSRCETLRAAVGLGDPMTNADRIRAMSDEELAVFINKCEGCGYLDSSVAVDEYGRLMEMIDWLRQPAKGGYHETD